MVGENIESILQSITPSVIIVDNRLKQMGIANLLKAYLIRGLVLSVKTTWEYTMQ